MLAAREDFSLRSFKDIQFKSNQRWVLAMKRTPGEPHLLGMNISYKKKSLPMTKRAEALTVFTITNFFLKWSEMVEKLVRSLL